MMIDYISLHTLASDSPMVDLSDEQDYFFLNIIHSNRETRNQVDMNESLARREIRHLIKPHTVLDVSTLPIGRVMCGSIPSGIDALKQLWGNKIPVIVLSFLSHRSLKLASLIREHYPDTSILYRNNREHIYTVIKNIIFEGVTHHTDPDKTPMVYISPIPNDDWTIDIKTSQFVVLSHDHDISEDDLYSLTCTFDVMIDTKP